MRTSYNESVSVSQLTYLVSTQTYYDIFVRNAFGNYRDVLKEVSYSPIMAEMLSYLDGQSTAKIWRRRMRLEYADENYAREIMQLFSIGLYVLNNDGTIVLDDDGKHLQTYSNDDITEYARLWTGFMRQPERGNIEGRNLGKYGSLSIELHFLCRPLTTLFRWKQH